MRLPFSLLEKGMPVDLQQTLELFCLTSRVAFARMPSLKERHNRILGDQRMGLGLRTETTRWRFLAGGRG